MKTASETNTEITVTHTPTPWLVTPNNVGVGHISSKKSGFGDIATTWGGCNAALAEANAALICKSVNAMPSILTLLEDIGNYLTDADLCVTSTGKSLSARIDAMIKEIRK